MKRLTNKKKLKSVWLKKTSLTSIMFSFTQLLRNCHFTYTLVSTHNFVHVLQISWKNCKKKNSFWELRNIMRKQKQKQKRGLGVFCPLLEVTLKRSKLQTAANIHHFYRDKKMLCCSITVIKTNFSMVHKSLSIKIGQPKFPAVH